MLISLAEYARRHGRTPATCRQMAGRGGFKTARRIGRDWLIDEAEPYPDHRRKDQKSCQPYTRAIQGRKDRRMSDTISRQAAIDAVKKALKGDTYETPFYKKD